MTEIPSRFKSHASHVPSQATLIADDDGPGLSRAGQFAFVIALLARKNPNAKLRRAAADYRKRIGG